MKWEHRCDLAWLKERQEYLTASDIRSLVPLTKTGRRREVTELDYLKVFAAKSVKLTAEDCMSYGAAARGHLLEPYAVDALNQVLANVLGDDADTFFWWDDVLVKEPGREIAFSPDAMNVPMTKNFEAPSAIAEIKCYEASKHMAVAHTMKDEIEERWQIATAMALEPTISHAYLVLFNPKVRARKTYVIRFDRCELENEIEMVVDVEDRWRRFRVSMPKTLPNGGISSLAGKDESLIIEEIEARQRLNP